ncbi:MAG: hypothetical protein FJ011_15905 [Chloroflexi bacterium]|nr:hypothetical protein [Chloroflexota bacterium]
METWYAFYTKPHCEFLADEAFTARGLTTYLPLWQPCGARCHELLFPRYLFVCCDLTAANNSDIRYLAGLGEMVAFDGQPVVVPEQMIGLIQEQLRQAASGKPSGSESVDELDAAGPLAGLSVGLGPSAPADVRGQALLSFLRQVNRPVALQDGAPIPKIVHRWSRGTRGHGRRIHYRTP